MERTIITLERYQRGVIVMLCNTSNKLHKVTGTTIDLAISFLNWTLILNASGIKVIIACHDIIPQKWFLVTLEFHTTQFVISIKSCILIIFMYMIGDTPYHKIHGFFCNRIENNN